MVAIATCCSTWNITRNMLESLMAMDDPLHVVIFDDNSKVRLGGRAGVWVCVRWECVGPPDTVPPGDSEQCLTVQPTRASAPVHACAPDGGVRACVRWTPRPAECARSPGGSVLKFICGVSG
jgi:hypothetical protein